MPPTDQRTEELRAAIRRAAARLFVDTGKLAPALAVIDMRRLTVNWSPLPVHWLGSDDAIATLVRALRLHHPRCCIVMLMRRPGSTDPVLVQVNYNGLERWAMGANAHVAGQRRVVGGWQPMAGDVTPFYAAPSSWN